MFGGVSMAQQTYPLTLSQLMIWGAETVLEGGPPAHLCWMVRLPGKLPAEHWAEIIGQVVSENEGLRLRMVLQDGEVRQYVAPDEPVSLPVYDFTDSGGAEALRRWVGGEIAKRLPLIDSPLYRFAILRCSGEEDRLFIVVHHLVADGWSITVLTDQIHHRHEALESGQPLVEPPTASFVRYIAQQTAPRPFERARLFLQSVLERRLAPAAGRMRPDLPAVAGGPVERVSYAVSPALRAEIERYSESQHSSVYLFLLTTILLYISLANDATDAAIGTIFHNRLDAAYRNTVGMFATVLPLRVAVADDLRFHELCRRVLASWKGAIRRQPEHLSLRELGAVYQHAAALFDTVVSYENHLPAAGAGVAARGHRAGAGVAAHRHAGSSSAGLEMEFMYRSEVYSAADIAAIHQEVVALSERVLADPEQKVGALRAGRRAL